MSSNPAGSKIVVLGALNTKPRDRTMSRESIKPVQFFDGISWKNLDFFSNMGDLGMSSFGFHANSNRLFFSTGQQISVLDINNGVVSDLQIDMVQDVHEMSVNGDSIWVANTGNDEALEIDVLSLKLRNRFSLRENTSSQNSDKFHMNQIFFDSRGSPLCLVHHVRGKQFLRQVKGRILKKQGDGGHIGLYTDEITELSLKAPHSIISSGKEYWVMNSGDQEINIYDKSWKLLEVIPTLGWGRGADISSDRKSIFIGISPIRKRYAGLIKESTTVEPIIQVFDSDLRTCSETIPIGGIEQINNLYLLSDKVISILERL